MKKNKIKLESVGEKITAKEASWAFNGKIPKTFDEHVRHSVPFYEEGHDLVCKLSDFFCKKQFYLL